MTSISSASSSHKALTAPIPSSVPDASAKVTHKNRIRWIDIGKGIGIVLVTFGHIRNGNYECIWLPDLALPISFIYLFHMPLFYFLGGLTFSSQRRFSDFLKIKTKTLLIPYYVFSLYFLVKPIAALINPTFFTQMHVGENYSGSIAKQFYDILINGDGLWFLWAYFIGELIVYPLSHIFTRKYQYLLTGSALIATYFTITACFPHFALPFRIITGVEVAGFIMLGIACKAQLIALRRSSSMILFCITAITSIALYMLTTGISHATHSTLCEILIMFLSIAACVFLSLSIMHCQILEHIGRYSLSFYAVNAFTLNLGKVVFFRLLHIDGTHASIYLQWVYGILLTIFCLVLLWIEDLLIRKLLPWSVGITKRKLTQESDSI